MYARNFGTGNTWIPGEITKLNCPVSFVVKCGDGKLIRRHQDHLRHRRDDQVTDQVHEQSDDISDDVWIDVSANDETVTEDAVDPQPATGTRSTPTVEATLEQSTRKQYPTRVCRPPDHL